MGKVVIVLNALKSSLSELIGARASAALQDAYLEIDGIESLESEGMILFEKNTAILNQFRKNFEANFDYLLESMPRRANVREYANPKNPDENDRLAVIAMEGMITHARNLDIREYIEFTRRLDSMFRATIIDESNNPMDPEQIGEAFKSAIQPAGLQSQVLLITYRNFNKQVFHKQEPLLISANALLVEQGVLPDLSLAGGNKQGVSSRRGRTRARIVSSGSKADGSRNSDSQLFAVMKSLIVKLDGKDPASTTISLVSPRTRELKQGMLIGRQKLNLLPQSDLIKLLNAVERDFNIGNKIFAINDGSLGRRICTALDNQLQKQSDAKMLRAIDNDDNDVINLVALLFDAIWTDDSVPYPIKELIGRTQLTVLKIALEDSDFFDYDDHPIRVLLNELACAGLGWIQPEKLERDPMYLRIRAVVTELCTEYEGDEEVAAVLVEQFRDFKRNQLLLYKDAEQRLQNAEERKRRLDEIERYAHSKIKERILDTDLHESAREFLEFYFHKFVVQVILREGPGGKTWSSAMSTVDVLLWTVQTDKQEGDLERFQAVNPRLLLNLRKTLEIADFGKSEIDAVLEDLRKAQELSFEQIVTTHVGKASDVSPFVEVGETSEAKSAADTRAKLPDDDEHLLEVDGFHLGIWLAFQVDNEQTIQCTLAVKFESIGKYVFVNAHGVKVIEKSRMGLARELKAGTVKIINEHPLIDHAIETVIGQLRAAQYTTVRARQA